jgi:hypothetical protein
MTSSAKLVSCWAAQALVIGINIAVPPSAAIASAVATPIVGRIRILMITSAGDGLWNRSVPSISLNLRPKGASF